MYVCQKSILFFQCLVRLSHLCTFIFMNHYSNLCILLLWIFAGFQLCITTSTSAGLEQTLPWLFYHKVIGVTNFFLFVEGKAATPSVSKVLESIPVSLNHSFSTTLYSFQLFWFSGSDLPIMVFKFLWQGVKVIYRTKELEEQQARRWFSLLLGLLHALFLILGTYCAQCLLCTLFGPFSSGSRS